MNDPGAHLPLHPNDFQILFSLVNGPLHGYGIVKEVEQQSEGRIRIDPANLYRSIKRMAASALVEPVEARAARGEPDRRRYYRITPFGLAVVKLEAARLASIVSAARARRLIPEERTR
jgi:DNA-binding PadR family transcriptional regulator